MGKKVLSILVAVLMIMSMVAVAGPHSRAVQFIGNARGRQMAVASRHIATFGAQTALSFMPGRIQKRK